MHRPRANLLVCAVLLGAAGAAHAQTGPYATPGGYGASYQALFPPVHVAPPPVRAPAPPARTPLDQQPLAPPAAGAAAAPGPAHTMAVGVLVSVKDGRATVRQGDTTQQFVISKDTQLVRSGKQLQPEQLQPGEQLLVQLRPGSEVPPVAALVVVVPAAPKPAPAR